MDAAAACASSGEPSTSLPGVVATPASRTTRFAIALSPISAMTLGFGPMNVRP